MNPNRTIPRAKEAASHKVGNKKVVKQANKLNRRAARAAPKNPHSRQTTNRQVANRTVNHKTNPQTALSLPKANLMARGAARNAPTASPETPARRINPTPQPDPTAPDGSDDGTAFETMRRHLEDSRKGDRGQGQETGGPSSRTADGVREPGENHAAERRRAETRRKPTRAERTDERRTRRRPTANRRRPAPTRPTPREPAGANRPTIPPNRKSPTTNRSQADGPENADSPQPNETQDGPGREGTAEDRRSDGTGAETQSGEHAGDQEQSRGQQDPDSPGGEQTSPKGES